MNTSVLARVGVRVPGHPDLPAWTHDASHADTVRIMRQVHNDVRNVEHHS